MLQVWSFKMDGKLWGIIISKVSKGKITGNRKKLKSAGKKMKKLRSSSLKILVQICKVFSSPFWASHQETFFLVPEPLYQSLKRLNSRLPDDNNITSSYINYATVPKAIGGVSYSAPFIFNVRWFRHVIMAGSYRYWHFLFFRFWNKKLLIYFNFFKLLFSLSLL